MLTCIKGTDAEEAMGGPGVVLMEDPAGMICKNGYNIQYVLTGMKIAGGQAGMEGQMVVQGDIQPGTYGCQAWSNRGLIENSCREWGRRKKM